MKKIKFLSIIALLAVFITACSSDDDSPAQDTCSDGIQNGDETGVDCGGSCEPCEEGNEVTKSGILTEDEHWTADNIYLLDNKVVVDEGITLTIDPGTIIKGKEGQETLLSALVVARGGTLIAEGTADEPIIFTSELDDIQPGQTQGTNLTVNDTGLWGGVLILGNAPISKGNDLEETQVEGLPADEDYGLFGGDDPDDSSGRLNYISIRHGGGSIEPDNEINGLSLAGVGSGTEISNIEVVGNRDDGVEWWGGTVNVTNAIVWGQGDDGFDTDEAWSGTFSNGAVIMTSNTNGSGLEMDGPNGSEATAASHTLENITLIGAGGSNRYADFRDGLLAEINNVLAYGFNAESTVRINGDDSHTEYTDGRLTISNWEIVLPDAVENPADIFIAVTINDNDEEEPIEGFDPSAFANEVTPIDAAGDASVGADMSVFDWTFAKAQGAY
ncbi:hypothetical protein LS482_02170 [Sinomicrobium kalidii]|uniref:hypothetical protein n=1 Tax=Sinomicrobium kalidii TaxID=2900738 RepID=UPI001E5770FE|nr:hypothetical protein [Sinomicrobium kalidii]UGU16687.1 hypothetical protein LS482_02170 [Sinomicrobium kalidii]